MLTSQMELIAVAYGVAIMVFALVVYFFPGFWIEFTRVPLSKGILFRQSMREYFGEEKATKIIKYFSLLFFVFGIIVI